MLTQLNYLDLYMIWRFDTDLFVLNMFSGNIGVGKVKM